MNDDACQDVADACEESLTWAAEIFADMPHHDEATVLRAAKVLAQRCPDRAKEARWFIQSVEGNQNANH